MKNVALFPLLTQISNVRNYKYLNVKVKQFQESFLNNVSWLSDAEKMEQQKKINEALMVPAPVAPSELLSNAPVDGGFISQIKAIYQIDENSYSAKANWDIQNLEDVFGENAKNKLLNLIARAIFVPAESLMSADCEILIFKKSYEAEGKIYHIIDNCDERVEWNDVVMLVIFNEVMIKMSSQDKDSSLESFIPDLNASLANMREIEEILDWNDDE